jgi:MFS family permease
VNGDDPQARCAIVGALLCQMSLGLGGYVFAVFLRPIVTELGWSRTAFSVSSLPLLLGMTIASPVVGAAAGRFGPRRVCAVGIVVVAVALASLAMLPLAAPWTGGSPARDARHHQDQNSTRT